MNGDNRFVFISPMFNASNYLPRMLHSIFGQSYDNWKIILIDDVSSVEHVNEAKNIINKFEQHDKNKLQVIWNTEKKWEVSNVLNGISKCNDNDIICRIDADDWLIDLDALSFINSVYDNNNCEALWTAHRWGYSDKNISGPMSNNVNVYQHPWVSSHLKTFRKKLINEVSYQNFLNENGELVKRAGDQAIYLPVLHKAKIKGFLPRVMYHYTINDVPETYQTDDAKFQKDEAIFLRSRGYVSSGDPWEDYFS